MIMQSDWVIQSHTLCPPPHRDYPFSIHPLDALKYVPCRQTFFFRWHQWNQLQQIQWCRPAQQGPSAGQTCRRPDRWTSRCCSRSSGRPWSTRSRYIRLRGSRGAEICGNLLVHDPGLNEDQFKLTSHTL